ncbi:zinc ribbon domain-containing protein [archaeon]|nr:zinc ribbon domain-containing protein [archaeon]
MPYCSNCGAKVLETDKFCNNCGTPLRPVEAPTPVNHAPPPPPPTRVQPSSPAGETIITTVSNFQKPKSFGRWDAYILLATNQNLIIVQLTKDMVNQSIKKAQDAAKAEGKGFFGQWAAQLGTSFDYAAQYNGWTKDQLLAEIPNALVLPHSSVTQVELRSENRNSYGKDYPETIYKLKIHVAGGVHEFESHSLDTKIKAFHNYYSGRFKTNVYF